MLTTNEIIRRAWKSGTVVPSYNIPCLPMLEPVVRALRDADSFGLIAVARPEWEKFQAGSPEAVAAEYRKWQDLRHTRLHLDHVPVLDEDNLRVDYLAIIRRALDAGFESVMVDGSRLPLEENIACTKAVVALAHARGIPVEAELGAVMGHESGPLPPYEELFASGKGFTDPGEARRFVEESGADWLSVAFGNIHGAVSAAAKATCSGEIFQGLRYLNGAAPRTPKAAPAALPSAATRAELLPRGTRSSSKCMLCTW